MIMRKSMAALLSILLVVAMALTITGCGGSTGSATNVVKQLFDSISNHDATKFLNCFEKDLRDQMLENLDKDEIKDQLESLDESLDDEYGSSWRKKVKIGKAEKDDEDDDITYYIVPVSFEDEDQEVTVMKVKGKYYIDESTFEDFMY